MIAEYTLRDFRKISKFPIEDYLGEFVSFVEVDQSNITKYYSGIISKPYEPSFNRLSSLLKQTQNLNGIIETIKYRLLRGDYWELLENLSIIQSSLWTIDNSSKWLRSSITKNNFNPSVEIDYITKQFQTLEQVSGDVVGSNDREQNWMSIAISNDLTEEEYSSKGGTTVSINFQNRNSIFLNSVVDNITGERIYGLDIDRKISFTDNDLTVLSYKNTINQAIEILGRLSQGMTPEFSSDGIQSSLIKGGNRGSLPFPIILRQFYNTFSKDDTLKSIKITNIEIQLDSFILDYQVETRFGETINFNVKI